MTSKTILSEKSMLVMESQIPDLATAAVKKAYWQALTTSGKVVEALNGELVETSADGSSRVIRSLPKSVPIELGMKITRVRKT